MNLHLPLLTFLLLLISSLTNCFFGQHDLMIFLILFTIIFTQKFNKKISFSLFWELKNKYVIWAKTWNRNARSGPFSCSLFKVSATLTLRRRRAPHIRLSPNNPSWRSPNNPSWRKFSSKFENVCILLLVKFYNLNIKLRDNFLKLFINKHISNNKKINNTIALPLNPLSWFGPYLSK